MKGMLNFFKIVLHGMQPTYSNECFTGKNTFDSSLLSGSEDTMSYFF